MINIMIANSVAFLADLAAWLVTPVPLIFVTLFLLIYVCSWVRCLTGG